jgi:oxygen-independent coproporphyrinogen-3 oxidase
VARVVACVRDRFGLERDAEVTLEANPGASDAHRFEGYLAAGVNRLSIGAQSFDDGTLALLGRSHQAEDVRAAVAAARSAGFTHLTLDLIHGVPGQTPVQAARDAEAAVLLGAEHVSDYSLTLWALAEEVPMAKAVARGEVTLPDDDAVAELGLAAAAALAQGGLRRYEISNWALPGREARHNGLYWQGAEIAAAGAGACGLELLSRPALQPGSPQPGARPFARRWQNDRSPEGYLARVERLGHGEQGSEQLTGEEHLRERLFTGLRLVRGLDLAELEAQLGLPVRDRFSAALDALAAEGLALREGSRLRLTERGLDLHSEVAVRFF